jgi:RNA polymerase sigma factor (sigma-70 family)
MEKEQKNREIIENMVKNAPGFRGNEDLLVAMCEECLKKAASFLESMSDDNSQNIYIKKIVNSTVVDILKRAEKIREEKTRKSQEVTSFQEIAVKYRTDENGRIIGDTEMEIPESDEGSEISDEKIEGLKNKINKINKENPEKQYGKIFELRFVKETGYQEIAEKLGKPPEEVLKTIRDIFREIKPFLAG